VNSVPSNDFPHRNDFGEPPLQQNDIPDSDLSHGGNLILSADECNSMAEKTVSVVTSLRSCCDLPVFFTHRRTLDPAERES
jgi:hypothetical protein